MASRVRDLVTAHNFKKPMRSSCGVITWQLQDKQGLIGTNIFMIMSNIFLCCRVTPGASPAATGCGCTRPGPRWTPASAPTSAQTARGTSSPWALRRCGVGAVTGRGVCSCPGWSGRGGCGGGLRPERAVRAAPQAGPAAGGLPQRGRQLRALGQHIDKCVDI